MPNISSSELIAQFQTALREGWGYIYGASGEIWTQEQQNAASREQTKKYGQKWVRTPRGGLLRPFCVGVSAARRVLLSRQQHHVSPLQQRIRQPVRRETNRWRAAQTRHSCLQIQRFGRVSPCRIVYRRGRGHRSQRHGVWRCHVENRQRVDALGRTERRGLRRERRTNCNESYYFRIQLRHLLVPF